MSELDDINFSNVNFDNIKTIEQPKNLKINLYRHQLSTVYQMEKLEINKKVLINDNTKYETVIGISSDMSGYGKTLSSIALIVRDKMQWDMNTNYMKESITSRSKGKIIKKTYEEFQRLNTTLILTNQSIILQWYSDLKNYTDLDIGLVTTRRVAETIDVSDFDVVIVSCTMYNLLCNRYNSYAWKRFIFDEPGHVKVPAMNSLVAGFYWFITATPDKIVSLHSRKNGLMNEILEGSNCHYQTFSQSFKYFIIKNDDEFVKLSFKMPQTNHLYYSCKDILYNTVKGFVNDNVMEMLSACNISGAIRLLGGTETSNIVDLVKQKKMEELEEINAKINIYTIRNDEERINIWTDKKNRINTQIEELDKRFKENLDNPCPICYSSIEKPVMEPKCQNIFCGSCLLNWLKNNMSCPYCRSKVDSKELVYINSSISENNKNDTKIELLTKQDQLIKIIKSKPDGKFIVFSSHDETFTNIRLILKSENISFTEIKGTFNSRDKHIQDFKDGKIPVIFLNSGYNGSGINLQESTDIILYHDMSVDTQSQIIGRANRIGRTLPLTVHHLTI